MSSSLYVVQWVQIVIYSFMEFSVYLHPLYIFANVVFVVGSWQFIKNVQIIVGKCVKCCIIA